MNMDFGHSRFFSDYTETLFESQYTSEQANIYFMGIYFNQEFENILDGVYFLKDMLDDIPISPPVSIFIQDGAIQFVTQCLNEPDKIYSMLKLDSEGEPHKSLYLYHFFDIKKIEDKHFKLYALISNIENMKRLLISMAYIWSPSLPYPHKDKDSEFTYVSNDTIKNYFKSLSFKKTQVSLHDLVMGHNIQNKYTHYITAYKKIQKIYEALDYNELSYLNDIRNTINHNTMHLTNWQSMISYDNDIKKLENIYSNLEIVYDEELLEYSNKCNICNKYIYLSTILKCENRNCDLYIGHTDIENSVCLEKDEDHQTYEFVKCSDCDHIVCKECFTDYHHDFKCSMGYCSVCNEPFCENCVTQCDHCQEVYYCEECNDINQIECESCNQTYCEHCAEEISECLLCEIQICPSCSDDGQHCMHCDEKLNKDD